MPIPTTLLELAGADMTPARVADACLVLIDLQNEYLDGPLAVHGANDAIRDARHLLNAAREHQSPIFHVAHKGRPGSLFDRSASRGEIVSALAPTAGEAIIEKQLPNAFAGTNLDALVRASNRNDIIICGFMTHMCVSSTTRAALDLGYRTTVAATACATRDLPDGDGGTLSADMIHNVAIAELSNRFAVIARNIKAIT